MPFIYSFKCIHSKGMNRNMDNWEFHHRNWKKGQLDEYSNVLNESFRIFNFPKWNLQNKIIICRRKCWTRSTFHYQKNCVHLHTNFSKPNVSKSILPLLWTQGLLKDANCLGVVCLCDSFLCRKLQLSLPQKHQSTESCRLLEQSHLVITCNKHL